MDTLPEITVEQFVDHISDSDFEYDDSLSKKILITPNRSLFSIKNTFLDDIILTNTKDKTVDYLISKKRRGNWDVIEYWSKGFLCVDKTLMSSFSTDKLIEFLNGL